MLNHLIAIYTPKKKDHRKVREETLGDDREREKASEIIGNYHAKTAARR